MKYDKNVRLGFHLKYFSFRIINYFRPNFSKTIDLISIMAFLWEFLKPYWNKFLEQDFEN